MTQDYKPDNDSHLQTHSSLSSQPQTTLCFVTGRACCWQTFILMSEVLCVGAAAGQESQYRHNKIKQCQEKIVLKALALLFRENQAGIGQ